MIPADCPDELRQRIEECARFRDLYEAELHGLQLSLHVHPHVQPSYSPRPELQARFEQGLEDGRAILHARGVR